MRGKKETKAMAKLVSSQKEAEIDGNGCKIGKPSTIRVSLTGLEASKRDLHLTRRGKAEDLSSCRRKGKPIRLQRESQSGRKGGNEEEEKPQSET